MEKDLTGEIVEIIANKGFHEFNIGEKVVMKLDLGTKEEQSYYAVSLDDSVGWFVNRSDFKLLKKSN